MLKNRADFNKNRLILIYKNDSDYLIKSQPPK